MSQLSDELEGLSESDAEWHLRSVLQDLSDDDAETLDRAGAIGKLAELILEQQKRIEALEQALANRSANEN